MVSLLKQAMRAHRKVSAILKRFKARSLNDYGDYINEYYPDETIRGIYMPVSASTIKELGLDVTREYYNFFVEFPIMTTTRNSSPDTIQINNRLHSVISVTDWYLYDGWKEILLIVERDHD